jgi:symplekin
VLGGQVKIDRNLLSDMLMGESTGLPTAPVLSILKPAALAYLEIESNLPSSDAEDALDINIERSSLEYDFFLSQKSYALTVNAVAVLAINRPSFFRNGAVCLARRCADPPSFAEQDEGTHYGSTLSKSSVLAIRSHIKSSCLTLLRNAMSVQTKSSTILHKVLVEKCNMKIQADKALGMAETTVKLKTAGRAARNQAKIHYEWDTSAADERTSKRKRETEDALAKMRTAKVARGLGNGIQLPSSTVDAIELVIENIKNLPSKRPPDTSKGVSKKKNRFSLDFLVDAIMTNGVSLIQEEGRWYSRDGGTAWSTVIFENNGERKYELNAKLMGSDNTSDGEKIKNETNQRKLFDSQCQTAASEALSRIVFNGLSSRSSGLPEFSNTVAARLAWMLKGVPPSENLKGAHDMARDSIQSYKSRIEENVKKDRMDMFAESFPIVTSCLSLSSTSTRNGKGTSRVPTSTSSLSNAIINEAYIQDACDDGKSQLNQSSTWKYDTSLDVFLSSVVHASERANEKPADTERKNTVTEATNSLQQEVGMLPRLSASAMTLVSSMCDLDQITKKAAEAARKNSQQSIAASAALHAAKQAAEKRANTALLVIRDACFQRSNTEYRKGAVSIAVGLAAGQANASLSCEEKALKLVINMLYPRSQTMADYVVEAATSELEFISKYAQENYSKIQKANRDAKESEALRQSPLAPDSEEEKEAMDKARKPTILFMALCIRRPELIKTLFELSSVDKADVLSKTVKQNMSKLARAVGMKHGSLNVALMVAEATSKNETSLLLSFLDTLAPVGEKNMVSEDFVQACYKIQELKAEGDFRNPRYLIPVIFAVKRQDLVPKLPEFVKADSDIFMAALVKMAERLGRQALLFRDEPNAEEPSLKGMTYCEELVFLHKLDFEAAGVRQKEYLDAIKMCLDNEEIFNDQVVMSALDHMSGVFLTGTESLPLPFMRTCILVCSKHESLHSWICHTLLPRLVDGKLYEESRRWEGWMRCAKMLENHADTGVSSKEAIDKLPPEQLALYKARYGM